MDEAVANLRKKLAKLAKVAVGCALGLGLLPTGIAPKAQAKRFGGYEIRVIRPKYMAKRGKIELSGQGTLIMNQSFIYSLLGTGLLDYHFTEYLALELGGSVGFSVDKEEKRILKDEFDIETQILRTKYIFSGGILWTPAYGKTQLPDGQVLYFDTFVTAQGGVTGIEYEYEQCIVPPKDKQDPDNPITRPAPQTKSYPTGIIGIGQKFFLSRDVSLRWDVRDHIFFYEQADGSCTPDVPIGTKSHQNVTLQLGASTFF